MTALVWDQVGKKRYEAGVDRGVVYAEGQPPAAWNGLVNVSGASAEAQASSYYVDGVRYLTLVSGSDYQGTIEAFTYPEEFAVCDGSQPLAAGLSASEQPPVKFDLTYRSLLGNDLEGTDFGYKIHLIYNAMVVPANKAYQSLKAQTDPSNFVWTFDTVPEDIPEIKPTAHLVVDSRKTNPFLLAELELILYGSELDEPRMIPPSELATLFQTWTTLTITDNEDGTWTADGPDEWITMLDPDTFQITADSAVFINSTTYNISSM
jgi:hypothetical protein